MKRIVIFLIGLCLLSSAKAQFPGTDSLRNYNNKYVTNNPATAFTNLRLNTLLRGIIDFIDTARAGTGGGVALGIDTLWALNDSTIRYRKNGVFRNTVLRGVYDTRRKVDTAYALNDSTLQIKINGTNRNIVLPGRHWDLQGVLNNGSTLTENEVITLADSLTFTSGMVVISTLNLPSLANQVDTTTYKPVVTDAAGNVHKMVGWAATPSIDTTNKWINDIRRSNDSVYAFKNGSWQFKYIDSTGGGSSGPPALTQNYASYGGAGNVLSPGEAAYTYDSITNTLYVDTINLKKAMTDTVRFRSSVLTPNGLRISANGDSYTVGTAATDLDDSSYIGITSSRYNMPVDNIAVTGSGAINAGYQHFINVNYPHTYMTTLMTGLNTLRIGGGTSKNFRKIVNAYKNIFCNHFSKTFYPASNTTRVTRHGSWTTAWASSSGGGKGGTQGAFTNTINDSIKYNFTDSTVWFSIIAGDGSGSIYTSPDIDVYIDNVLIENYDLNNQTDGTADGSFDGRLTPVVRYYTGLTYGAHTIKIVNKANLYLLFDGFGNLVDRNSANTYVGYHVPKMTAAGYATAPTNSSDAITDTMNVKLDSLFATFPSWYPAFLVPVNNYYLPNSGDVTAGVDDVHPNNQGHRHIADATFAMLGNGANNVESGTVIYTLGNLYLKNDTGAIVKIIAGDVVYNQGQTILNDTMRIGAHNDKPVAIISNGQTAASFRQNQGVYGNVADFYGPTRAFGPVYAEAANIELKRSWTFSGGISNSIGTWTGGGTGWGLSENFIGTANSRFWGLMVQENGFFGRLVNDAGSFTNWLDVRRTGTHADSISFPMGKIYLGEMTRVASADSVLTWDVATQQVRLTPASGGADGNGIYGGNGTLPGDVTVTGANNSLTFNDIFAHRINSDYNVIAKANGTGTYSEAVIGAGNIYEIGYTPTPGVYSKGAGVFIDTNENVGIGAQPPTTMPLYATGASFFVQGLQSNQGNFMRVDNVATTGSLGLTNYFVTIDATAGNVTLTLPAASTAFGNSMGIKYVVQRIDNSGNTITIQRAGSDTINGTTSFTLGTQWESKNIQCTSTSTWAQH